MPAAAGTPSEAADSVHPLARDALRVSLTPKEYRLLHDYALARSSRIKDSLPVPSRFESIVRPRNKHNEAAVRSSLRVFLGSGAALKLADLIIARIQGVSSRLARPIVDMEARSVQFADLTDPRDRPKRSLVHSPNFRLSLALSLVLLLHRLLYRFFVRLRANLRTDDARPFRARNPRVSQALTSRYAPAVAASAAGLALGISPQRQLRMTAAIYTATRSLEFLYNVMDQKGWCANRPWWFGSWLLMPVSCAQLFHAFVFDRETAPKVCLSLVILGLYVLTGPVVWEDHPQVLARVYPGPSRRVPGRALLAGEGGGRGFACEHGEHEVAVCWMFDSVSASADRDRPFASPILFPSTPSTLPASLKSVSSITALAHPSIPSLSCALLHPGVPSCNTAFLHHILLSVPPLARFLGAITLALSAFRLKDVFQHPIAAVNGLSKRIISLTAVFSAALGVAWGSVCFWSNLLPRSTLPTKRFFLSGALGGLPFMFLGNSRSTFLYFFRAAVDSAWKAGVKRGLWKGWRGGELWVVVLSWALMGAILEARPSAVQGRGVRKALAWMKGDGFADPVDVLAKRKAKKAGQKES